MSHEHYSRVDINKGSSNRSFGLVFAVLFFGIAFSPLLSGASPRYWGVAVSCALLLISMFKPSFLNWPNRGWTQLGKLLHKITNPLVLAVLFFLVITPYAIIMRIFRKDQLGLTREQASNSHWQKRTGTVQNMKHQF